MKRILRLSFTALILLNFISQTVKGIPAFARKYQISCTTCHTPAFPMLKPYGEEFAGNGFQLADQQSPRYYIETGDQKLTLLRDFPLAVRFDGFVTWNFANEQRVDMASPYIMKLLSGGALSDRLSYYFYFYFSERGEIAGIEDAFLMYNDLFGIDFDIALGQFQVSDPLFKRELRLSLEDYVLYTPRIGRSGINLTYDKGIMMTLGLPTGTGVTFEVVNGNGIGEAENRVFDDDRYKNILLKVSQDIAEPLTVGAFIYAGKENIEDVYQIGETNEVFMWGPDLSFAPNQQWILNAQFLVRDDSNALMAFEPSEREAQTKGAMAELIFSPKGDQSNWYLLGLYNWIESDYDPANYQSATFHAGYLLRRNVRLAAEYTLNFTDSDNPYNLLSFGFVSAF